MDNVQNITNCPICGKHCPIDAVSCGRGQALVEKIKNGEEIDIEAIKQQFGKGEHGSHGEHDENAEGHDGEGHDGGHGRHGGHHGGHHHHG